MSTEELPADLDKLKITPKSEHTKLCERNPFYSPSSTSSTDTIVFPMLSTKQNVQCKMRRIRRRSESNVDDIANKHLEIPIECDIANPLRCLPGVNKLQLKRGSMVSTKRSLLREPVLRIAHDNLHVKCGFSNRIRRSTPSNSDGPNRKPRTLSLSIKSGMNGISSFRDLISECNSLLDESKSKKESLDSTRHLSKNFTTCQQREVLADKSCDGEPINATREQPIVASNSRLSCSQEAGNSARNGDDVTIVELASYFDTMVHIPKKMSSMAEMMYI